MIARHEGNISNLKIVNRSMDFFDMVIDVEVADVKHLADIIAALRATPASTRSNARATDCSPSTFDESGPRLRCAPSLCVSA